MEYLRDQSIVEESATLLVAWLDLLTGMASGEEGARNVFQSLLTSHAGEHTRTDRPCCCVWCKPCGLVSMGSRCTGAADLCTLD